ncbi:uncharacterized protein LOC126971302 [Leptidea sinapis]|uniref:uncharacterized protein LOC126971302 n=1 Tax=Leptidea sinapis TaxID=189913 RepID=UPI0021C36C50|nr:uncharacterized protein LOC126971302 [Leptidea sinapis]
MELSASMVVPPAKLDSSGIAALKRGSGPLHIDSPTMDEILLDSRHPAQSNTSPVSHCKSSQSTGRHKDVDASTSNTRNPVGSVADFGWSEVIEDWSEEDKALLLSSWRKSTLNTYAPAWRKWKEWCAKGSTNFKFPSPTEVARYLAYLHNVEGLAYRTILVHKSVISIFTNITNNVDLSSNFFIKHILKAISVSRVKSLKPPIWDPKILTSHLSKVNPNENNMFEVSKRTAILLLLSSGRRVHDLTLLHIGSGNFIDKGDSVLLWPVFGSKTDKADHRQSGWKMLKNTNQKICCVYWIRRLIQVSQERREKGNYSHLFITTRGSPRPATRTIIGGWVKSAPKDAGINAPPGSVRSAVGSLNWLENFSIDQILSTGNWKSEHTFRKYYQKQIISNVNNQESLSLSNYFNAVK